MIPKKKQKAKITILDAIHAQANKTARAAILPCLRYEATHWRRRKLRISESYLITGNKNTGGTFLTGLLPRIKNYCRESEKNIIITKGESFYEITPTRKRPFLSEIEFRSDQTKALRAIRKRGRGIIKFPTGSGKTIIALGLFSMYEESPTLFLCHTVDLLTQTSKSLGILPKKREWLVIGGGIKPEWNKIKRLKNPIVISTVQTFSKYDPRDWADFFDITIVDECHRVNSEKSLYGKTMQYNLSPIRIGLSATPPTKGKEQLICEGFFGPVISELTMEEGIKKEIIARPKINLVSVPYEHRIQQDAGKSWAKIYQLGIVNNQTRNDLILKEAQESLSQNKIVLIIIEQTEHGKVLQKIFSERKIEVPFVWGSTASDEREKVKEGLKTGELRIAICSKVWREGVNIPSLNHIINAHGMKEEKIIIQAMGRGLRTYINKTEIRLTDFLDPYTHLAQHAIKRIQIYTEQGWL